jgi:YrbI family 3-deoxy-D-manno-octulosonate 8-phosphate phosphatase
MAKYNLKNIDLIVYDFDGVMTDNKSLIFDDGKEAVFCNRADGLAIYRIKELGIPQIILSTEENRVVEARAKKLNIEVIYGVRDKKSTLIDFCKKKNYNLKRVLYIGNDINDLEVMKSIGYPIAPQDAYKEIKKIAKIIINVKGGNGVIRKLYEMIIK